MINKKSKTNLHSQENQIHDSIQQEFKISERDILSRQKDLDL